MDSDGSTKYVPGESKDNNDVTLENQQQPGNLDIQSGTDLTSAIPTDVNNIHHLGYTPAMTHHETKRQRSASPAGPSTSDDEDCMLRHRLFHLYCFALIGKPVE
jgi:hypothetical protein